MSRTATDEASFADALDPLLHQPLRTQICAYLVGRGEATFSELKRVLQCTDGNLDAHLKKLIAANYLQPERTGSGTGSARVQTAYALTPAGREAFSNYLLHLQKLFQLAAPGEPSLAPAVRTSPA